MTDIITEFIASEIVNRLRYNTPIESVKQSVVYTKDQLKHLSKCRKQICSECSEILK